MSGESHNTLIKDFEISNRPKNALIRHGWNTLEDLTNKTLEDFKQVKGLGKDSLAEVQLYLKVHYKHTVPKKPKQPDPNYKLKRDIISRFIKGSLIESYNPAERSRVWAHNMQVINTLMKKYPDVKFWEQFEIGFKLNTLTFFYREKGKEVLEKEYNKWHLAHSKIQEEKKEEVVLSEEKSGEDIIVTELKPKNIRDFLGL